jgi:hypothetical protein
MAGRRLAGCFPHLAKRAGSRGAQGAARSLEPSFFFLACDDLLARSAFIQQEGLNLLFIPDAREPTSCHSAFLMDLASAGQISTIRCSRSITLQ